MARLDGCKAHRLEECEGLPGRGPLRSFLVRGGRWRRCRRGERSKEPEGRGDVNGLRGDAQGANSLRVQAPGKGLDCPFSPIRCNWGLARKLDFDNTLLASVSTTYLAP